jgi:hypothetical protein
VSSGANVKAVQRFLGLASAAMKLDRYENLFDDDLDAVADRLDTLGRAAGGYPVCTSTEIEIRISTPQKSTHEMTSGHMGCGRYWDRTSDPCRVKAVLSR